MLKGERPLPNLPAEASHPSACLEQGQQHPGCALGWALGRGAGTNTHCLLQCSPNTGGRELNGGCSPQPKVLHCGPLPSQPPGSCQGAAWLMAARCGGSFVPVSIPRAAGKLYAACEQTHAAVGRATRPLRCATAVVRWLCPRRKGCDQQEMRSSISLQVTQSPSGKSEDDSGCFPQLHPPPSHDRRNYQGGHPSYLHDWIPMSESFLI